MGKNIDIDNAELTPELEKQLGEYAKAIRKSLHPSTYFFYSTKSDPLPLIKARIAQRFLVEEFGYMGSVFIMLFISGVVSIFMSGVNLDSLLLLILPVISTFVIFVFMFYIAEIINKRKSSVIKNLSLSILMVLIPFSFGLYLITYKGFALLFIDFSIIRIIKTIIFLLFGHIIARSVRMMQAFHWLIVEQNENK